MIQGNPAVSFYQCMSLDPKNEIKLHIFSIFTIFKISLKLRKIMLLDSLCKKPNIFRNFQPIPKQGESISF